MRLKLMELNDVSFERGLDALNQTTERVRTLSQEMEGG